MVESNTAGSGAARDSGSSSRVDARRNRDRLLDAAALVLSRELDPTLAQIADVAGLSRATAYRHFADVDALRVALSRDAEQIGRDLLQGRLAALFAGGEEGLAPIAEQMTELLAEGLRLRNRWTASISNEPPHDAGLVKTFSPIARGLLRRGQLRGEFRSDINLDLTSEALASLAIYAARTLGLQATCRGHGTWTPAESNRQVSVWIGRISYKSHSSGV